MRHVLKGDVEEEKKRKTRREENNISNNQHGMLCKQDYKK